MNVAKAKMRQWMARALWPGLCLGQYAVAQAESTEAVTKVHRLASPQRAPFDAFVYVNRIPEAAEADETAADFAGRIFGRLANQEGRILLKVPPGMDRRAYLGFKTFLGSEGDEQVQNCVSCHAPPAFTDGQLHVVSEGGTPVVTPSLRNPAQRKVNLEAVLRTKMRAAERKRAGKADDLDAACGLITITEADLPRLVAFLETLNDVPNAAFRKLIIDAEVLDTSAGFDEARVPRERKRPNVVTLLADDLGWKDLGCYGGPVKTPVLDKLAAGGVRFTDFHSGAPSCSPSRATFLTGRNHRRTGVYSVITERLHKMHLLKSETTIAEVLKENGYATAHFGKWHLGMPVQNRENPTPGDHGSDYWFGLVNGPGPSHKNPTNFLRNGKRVGPMKGYSCQIVVDEALTWLDEKRDAGEPFFLNLWFNEPHAPIAAPDEIVSQYGALDDQAAIYSGTIDNTDRAIGRLVAKLEKLGELDNTIIIYFSDNGSYRQERNGELRGKKGSLFEGGHRVPGIIYWKGGIPGGRVEDELLSQTRILLKNATATDRDRLQEYFESVRTAEKNFAEEQVWLDHPKPEVQATSPLDIQDKTDLVGRIRLLLNLVPLIIQTDSSRVISVVIQNNHGMPQIDGVESEHHNLSHHGRDPKRIDQLKKIERGIMSCFGDFLVQMKAKQEEGGSLMDSTMTLFGSNLGNASAHDPRNNPILLAGGVFSHGQYVAHNARHNTPLCNLFLSMLGKMKIDTDSFSSSTGRLEW
jgi:hypothetical protein